jgi:hypothetical protein
MSAHGYPLHGYSSELSEQPRPPIAFVYQYPEGSTELGGLTAILKGCHILEPKTLATQLSAMVDGEPRGWHSETRWRFEPVACRQGPVPPDFRDAGCLL